MTATIITDRVVAFLPETPGKIPSDLESALAALCRMQELTALNGNCGLFACNVIDGAPEPARTKHLVLDILPGTAAAGRPFDRLENLSDWSSRHALLEQEAQLYNLFDLNSDRLELESDPLGLKPLHYADVAGGRLLFSKILDGLRLLPELIKPLDPVALNQLLTSRATIPNRTIHERIRRTPTGLVLKYGAQGTLRWDRDRRLRPPPIRGNVFAENVFNENESAVSESIRAKTKNLGQPLLIALSGGFDSRILAAHCAAQDMPFQAVSFGDSHHPELKNARDVASLLGIDLHTLDYDRDNSITSLPRHLAAVEATADLSTVSIAQLFRFAHVAGTGLVHGFAGDLLSGAFVSQISTDEYRSRADLTQAILGLRSSAAIDGEKLLAQRVDESRLFEETLAQLDIDAEPHQAYLYWNFENRQRRYTASHFPIIGSSLDPVLPFLDRTVIDLWTSLPPVALENRNLFRRLLAERHAKLARIPHPEEGIPIVPNLEYQIKYLWHSMPRRILTALLGGKAAKATLGRLGRDTYIWSLANLASPRHQRHMTDRIEELRSVASQVLDLDISPDFEDLTRGNIQAKRTLFMVCEYALHLREELKLQ